MFTLIFIGFIDRYTSYRCHLPTRTLVLAVCSLWTIAGSTMAKQSAIWLKMITVSVHNVTVSLSDVFIACKLVFLPLYSPDYNPIEQAFSAIKAHLHRHSGDPSLMSIIHACQSITPDKAEGYFRASGYIA